jgi:hypothetical protein
LPYPSLGSSSEQVVKVELVGRPGLQAVPAPACHGERRPGLRRSGLEQRHHPAGDCGRRRELRAVLQGTDVFDHLAREVGRLLPNSVGVVRFARDVEHPEQSEQADDQDHGRDQDLDQGEAVLATQPSVD